MYTLSHRKITFIQVYSKEEQFEIGIEKLGIIWTTCKTDNNQAHMEGES